MYPAAYLEPAFEGDSKEAHPIDSPVCHSAVLGKQRIIDNAHTGGQSAFSSESNRLVLCSALRPAQHASLAVSALGFDRAKEVLQHGSLEGGGEDWPNAYRSCPMSADESRACVVCWHHREWGVPAYQLYTGLLFGLPLAVASFNRYSRFSEALGRRLLFLDDAHVTDWSSSKGSGQQAFRDLSEIMGSPFAEDKRQDMAPTGTFLGLDFDLSEISGDGAVAFWVQSRLQEKVEDMLATAERTGVLPPGVASKLYGVLNFLEQGMYGRVGTGGLQALKARQTEKVVELTGALRQSMEVIRAVLAMRPRRRVEVFPSEHCRFVAASDAAEDVPGEGTGASCWFGALDFPRGRPLWPRCRPQCIRSSHLATTRLRSSSCRWCSMPSRRAPRASGGPGASGISTMWWPLCVSFVDAVILPIWNGWPT